jgi:hypothetical protein
MVRRWVAVVAVVSAVLGGCGDVAAQAEDSAADSTQQSLRYCDAQTPCLSGQVCAEGACFRACDYGATTTGCASGYTCCMGYVSADGSTVSPYCSTLCFYP